MASSTRTPNRSSPYRRARSLPKGDRRRESRKKNSSGFSYRKDSQGNKAPKKTSAFSNERFGEYKGVAVRRERNEKAVPVRPTPPQNSFRSTAEGQARLHKVMANAGVASRRVCEEMIADGRVEVNGKIVTHMGVKVTPENDHIAVDGMTLQTEPHLSYVVFNKPRGVVSTMEDPEGRPCLNDYLGKYRGQRLFHVGRLDADTEGLLLLTNDGDVAHRLAHPRYEVPKTYLVQVPGPMKKGVGRQLLEGIVLEDGFASVDDFRLVGDVPGKVLVEVVLHSGKNRIVRRMFKQLGYSVERLVRVKFGPVNLGNQKVGSARGLGNQEIGHLLAAVGL